MICPRATASAGWRFTGNASIIPLVEVQNTNLTVLAQSMLSNVSLGTANILAYLMLVVVAVFLLSGPAIYYFFSRKRKQEVKAEPAASP